MSWPEAIAAEQAQIDKSTTARVAVAQKLAAFASRRQAAEEHAREIRDRLEAMTHAVASVQALLSGASTATIDFGQFGRFSEIVGALQKSILSEACLEQLNNLRDWPDRAVDVTADAEEQARGKIDEAAEWVEDIRETILGHADAVADKGEEYAETIGAAAQTVISHVDEMKETVLEGIQTWRELSDTGAKDLAKLCADRLRKELEGALGDTAASAKKAIESASELTERTFGKVNSVLDGINDTIGGVMDIIEPVQPAVDAMAAL